MCVVTWKYSKRPEPTHRPKYYGFELPDGTFRCPAWPGPQPVGEKTLCQWADGAGIELVLIRQRRA